MVEHRAGGDGRSGELLEATERMAAGQVFQHVPESSMQQDGMSEAAYRRGLSDAELLAANMEKHKNVMSGADGSVSIDISTLHRTKSSAQRRQLLDRALETQDQDNEALLTKYKQRLDRAGVELSKVEVRFENLNVSADVSIGNRGMPTVANAFYNTPKDFLTNIGLLGDDKHHLSVLNNVSGVLKPGRFTLLLGPPGGGKTTLLKALAGAAKNGANGLNMSGQVTYNGEGFDKFQAARTCAYISQVDIHLAELTVRETFDFAARCLGVGHKAEYAAQLNKREAEMGITPDPELAAMTEAEAVHGKRHTISTDLMLRILGLEVCADTKVGNQLMRGISGGQKKRVTTGELLVGPAKTLFMDEISTGLDASTTLLIVRCIRNFVHLMQGTVLMALLQPPPEVFDLFDDIMLLSEGQVVYHGTREQVVPFFSSIGFSIPERKGVADFLQEVTSFKDQQQYWSRKDQPYQFVSMEQFHQAYLESPEGVAMAGRLAAPVSPSPPGLDPLVRTKYALTGWQAFKACMRRELILVQRNAFLYTFKTWQVFFVAIVTGTLFLYTQWGVYDEYTGTIYLGLIFYSIVHVMFNGYSEMSLMCASLPTYYKHKAAQFFPAWSFALPTTLVRMPYSLVEGVLWSCVAYWLTGCAPDAGRFFVYLCYMVLTHNMAIGMFRLMGALGRDYNRTNVYGSFAMVLTILLGGFVLRKSSIHPWYIWVYWLSPLTYVQQALSLNEFTHPRWQTPLTVNGVTKPTSIWVLESYDLATEDYWRWMPALVLIGFWLLFNYLTFVALTVLPPPQGDSPLFSEEYLQDREYNRTGSNPTTLVTSTKGSAIKRIVSMGTLNGTKHSAADKSDMLSDQGTSGSPASSMSASSTPVAANGHSADGVMRVANGTTGKDVELGMVPAGGAGRGKSVGFAGDAAVPTPPASEHGMTLPFEPMALSFKDVCYYVDLPKGVAPSTDDEGNASKPKVIQEGNRSQIQLLHNITGSFRPGVLCALMGVSGAGKTTLMDVLAGRKTVGRISGDIFVDGRPKVQDTFARVMGYVEQSDIHSARTTVREALVISAVLRLTYTRDRGLIEAFADEVMALTELGAQRDALVGQPGLFGLSLEQRKRLTIGVELVANPSIVFMDEPTSGLDARAAAIVMRAVRNTVNTGRTVVCTIHQPSIDIFESFDELLLLKRGGRVMYQGPLGERSCHLVDYFQAIPGCGTLPGGLNPATWMLEVSTVSREAALGRDFADIYEASDMARANNELADKLSHPKEGSQPLHFEHPYAASMWEQFKTLSYRAFVSYWRNPEYNTVRFAFCIMLGLFLGTIYLFLGERRGSTTDIFNVMGALFICTTFLGTSNSSGIMPIVGHERPVFYRERASGMYNALPYVVAQVLVEFPYVLAQTLLYSAVTYFLIHFEFNAGKFFWYCLFTYLTLLFFTFYGFCVVAISPQVMLAAIMSSMFFSVWFIMAGFFIPYKSMPRWAAWYYWLDPLSYLLYGIITSQLGDDQTLVESTPGKFVTVQQYLQDTLGFGMSFVPWCILIMVGYIVVFVSVIVLAFAKLNYNRR